MRRGAGGRLRAPGVAMLAALALVGSLWAGAQARAPRGPGDHHATVRNGTIMGSAFLIAPGVAVTNAHVVAGLSPGAEVSLAGLRGQAPAAARLVAVSRRMDLAVLRAPAGAPPPVGPEDAPGRRGLAVRAAGVDASGGPGSGARMELGGRVERAGAHVPAYGPGLVVTLPGVRPGFSGGPVLDAAGRLVGMVAAIRPGPGGRAGAPAAEAYVLAADELRREAARLLAAAERGGGRRGPRGVDGASAGQ